MTKPTKNALRRMYWDTTRISYRRRGMDLEAALRSSKSRGDACVVCTKDLPAGTPVVTAEYRIGGKTLGKTVRAEACVECAKAARDLIDLRIREATSP